MKNIYIQPTVSVLALNVTDIIASSGEEFKEITHNVAGGVGDVIPY